MKRVWIWLPLGLFALFCVVVASGLLSPDDRLHPSRLVGKPMPAFTLPPAATDRPGFGSADLKGRARLVNVFASWCVPCAAEAPILGALAQQGVVVDGIAIRDRRPDLDAFLARNGNPFRAIGLDTASEVQMAMGSSGVPETFVVDARGVIRFQHIGEITPRDVPALLAKLREVQ